MRYVNSAVDETISRRPTEGEQKLHSWGERCHVPTNECVWLKRIQQQANRIPIKDEQCVSTTPLETLTPDVIFISNEIEILNSHGYISANTHRRHRNSG